MLTTKKSSLKSSLPVTLRDLVHQTVALLGDVLRRELGVAEFRKIEKLRWDMTKLRGSSTAKTQKVLAQHLKNLQAMKPQQQLNVACAFTLMLELMNACENAYRSREIKRRVLKKSTGVPDSIIYVLTAHPTEARSKENIWIFHEILKQLTVILERSDSILTEKEKRELTHQLEIAWKISVVRNRKPRVQDEAEHIYSTLLRDETLRTLLECQAELAPIYIRSWVGGDKDGHPGVDEKVFRDSLSLSRQGILSFMQRRLLEVREELNQLKNSALKKDLLTFEKSLAKLRQMKTGDARSVLRLKKDFKLFCQQYEKAIHGLHPALSEIKKLWHLFPALVVPLEFRESSDVLLSSPSGKGLAIFRMLKALAMLSRGGDPKWYVRGFIISMASELRHMQIAAHLTKLALGTIRLPIIPLFEQLGALKHATKITSAVLQDPTLSRALKTHWDSCFEVMLGYSDSSKESGVLQSRLAVAETMYELDSFCRRRHVTPLFFQGSGGSTDRGGGSVQEQTAWWSTSALRNYKVTIQGEMVERSLANPEITRGQLERITQAAGEWKKVEKRKLSKIKALDDFAAQVAKGYRTQVASENFLKVVEHATPYPFLNLLKMGSRPTKRSKKLSVEGLRAIPWILCWTQTRLLFPTWWGIGTAWSQTEKKDRAQLIKAYQSHPLFASYVRALGFTLAKVEMGVWNLYLEQSGLSPKTIQEFQQSFEKELQGAKIFVRAILGSRDLIPWRPWLQDSITLRSPMIHPLNLLQIIAMKQKNAALLRLSVTGISSGMMTTG